MSASNTMCLKENVVNLMVIIQYMTQYCTEGQTELLEAYNNLMVDTYGKLEDMKSQLSKVCVGIDTEVLDKIQEKQIVKESINLVCSGQIESAKEHVEVLNIMSEVKKENRKVDSNTHLKEFVKRFESDEDSLVDLISKPSKYQIDDNMVRLREFFDLYLVESRQLEERLYTLLTEYEYKNIKAGINFGDDGYLIIDENDMCYYELSYMIDNPVSLMNWSDHMNKDRLIRLSNGGSNCISFLYLNGQQRLVQCTIDSGLMDIQDLELKKETVNILLNDMTEVCTGVKKILYDGDRLITLHNNNVLRIYSIDRYTHNISHIKTILHTVNDHEIISIQRMNDDSRYMSICNNRNGNNYSICIYNDMLDIISYDHPYDCMFIMKDGINVYWNQLNMIVSIDIHNNLYYHVVTGTGVKRMSGSHYSIDDIKKCIDERKIKSSRRCVM